MKKLFTLLIILGFAHLLISQHTNGYYKDRTIDFPDIPGYVTLTTDLHIHTVLSDGYVWPNIRVDEAERDGLDVISITDHIEYQPHESDLPHPDRNRSYEIASKSAEGKDLIIINGAEITRNMPPGHCNAIFLEDVNKLNIEDSLKAFKEANQQGAFVFWNHPNWEAQVNNGVAAMTDIHRKLIKKGMLHGIEVVNDVTYSDEALQIALDFDLTIMGTSDIHGLVDWQYDVPGGGHRPVTLVFAKDKTAASLKEALFAKRTVVFFNDMLIGREEFLLPLLNSSVVSGKAVYGKTWAGSAIIATLLLDNRSDAPIILENKGDLNFHDHADIVVLPANSLTELRVKTIEKLSEFELKFEVLNAVTAPATHPQISFVVKVAEE